MTPFWSHCSPPLPFRTDQTDSTGNKSGNSRPRHHDFLPMIPLMDWWTEERVFFACSGSIKGRAEQRQGKRGRGGRGPGKNQRTEKSTQKNRVKKKGSRENRAKIQIHRERENKRAGHSEENYPWNCLRTCKQRKTRIQPKNTHNKPESSL